MNILLCQQVRPGGIADHEGSPPSGSMKVLIEVKGGGRPGSTGRILRCQFVWPMPAGRLLPAARPRGGGRKLALRSAQVTAFMRPAPAIATLRWGLARRRSVVR